MIKFILILICLIGSSCYHSHRTPVGLDFPSPPPPPPQLRPNSFPPNFSPNIDDLKNVQINTIPHPFNLNGSYPFAVWVDGKKIPLNHKEVKSLANALDIEFSQPPNTARIHNGEGWLYPFPIKEKDARENLNNRKYGQKEASSQ